MGVLNSMNTIMMLKICSELPVMYMPKAFIGRDFAGAMAISQAFLSFSVSISSGLGGLRAAVVVDLLEDLEFLAEEVKPGGSGMAVLGLGVGGVVVRSRSH